jgi:hypothetical protein
MIIYTDDTIITGPDVKEIDTAIADIASRFEITSKESVSDFLRVNIDRHDDNTVTLPQPKLIQTILNDLGLQEDSNTLPIPAPSTKNLHVYADSNPHKENWHYRSIIGKLSSSHSLLNRILLMPFTNVQGLANNPKLNIAKQSRQLANI